MKGTSATMFSQSRSCTLHSNFPLCSQPSILYFTGILSLLVFDALHPYGMKEQRELLLDPDRLGVPNHFQRLSPPLIEREFDSTIGNHFDLMP